MIFVWTSPPRRARISHVWAGPPPNLLQYPLEALTVWARSPPNPFGYPPGSTQDCPVCLVDFDDTERRPRTMPCGHTLCSPCIDNIRNRGHVTCPTCRIRHAVPNGGQFPVSYAMEDLLRRFKGVEVTSSAAAATGSSQRKAAGLSHRIHSKLQEQEAKVVAAIKTCQEVQSQLGQYQTTMMGWCNQQQQLEDRLQSVIDQSKTARELMCAKSHRATAKKEKVKEGEHQLHAALEVLRAVTTKQEALPAIDDAAHCTHEAKQTAGECQEMFLDADIMNNAREARKLSDAALEAVQSIHMNLDTMEAAGGSACAMMTPSLASLEAEDLRSLRQPAKSLVEAGQVFATQRFKRWRQYGRISLEDGQLYLHFLQKQTLPLGAVTLQVSEVVPSSPPCLVFLDLSWPGTEPRRVIIHLSHDTPLGRQFMLLCTGEYGPSYANTTMLRVSRKGQPGEHVFGGDYERNDETGGQALLSDFEEYDYPDSGKVGSVWGRYEDSPHIAAQFGILTRKRDDGVTWHGVFGKVTRGIHVLQQAAHQGDIQDVTVVDCGVVLFSSMQRGRR